MPRQGRVVTKKLSVKFVKDPASSSTKAAPCATDSAPRPVWLNSTLWRSTRYSPPKKISSRSPLIQVLENLFVHTNHCEMRAYRKDRKISQMKKRSTQISRIMEAPKISTSISKPILDGTVKET